MTFLAHTAAATEGGIAGLVADALRGEGHGSRALAAIGIVAATWLLRRYAPLLRRLHPGWTPWVAIVISALAGASTALAAGHSLPEAIGGAVETALIAAGSWSAVFKHIGTIRQRVSSPPSTAGADGA